MSYRQQYFFGMTLTAILKNLTGHSSVLSSLILNKSLKFCFCEHPTSTYPWVMNWSTYEQKKSKISFQTAKFQLSFAKKHQNNFISKDCHQLTIKKESIKAKLR